MPREITHRGRPATERQRSKAARRTAQSRFRPIGDGVKAMRDSASSKVTQRISAVSASNVPVSLTGLIR